MVDFIDDLVDVGSSAVSGVGDFFFGSGGGGKALDGSFATSTSVPEISRSGGFFSEAANFAGEAFSWLGDPENATATNLLGGVALGVGQAYTAGKDREQRARDNRLDRQMQRDLQAERLQAQQIAPGEGPSNYGSYGAGITRGLLSNGMLASDEESS
jgi:hypothetical protein